MIARILHCGKDPGNYNICLRHQMAGFPRRGQKKGEMVYFAVRVKLGKTTTTVCGARGILSEEVLEAPWEGGAERYVSRWILSGMEYCNPFDISAFYNLLPGGGQEFAIRFLQGAKPISDATVIDALKQKFSQNRVDSPVIMEELPTEEPAKPEKLAKDSESEPEVVEGSEPIEIMGTFNVVNFKGERDPNQGLESLVNRYFHSLFPEFPESTTLLVPENRLFKTKGPEKYEGNGVCGIPDALMLLFRPDKGGIFFINLIEYECYGQAKYKAVDRFNYMNGHIIPQLIRFASAFSVVTDKGMRDNTVMEWTKKLLELITKEDESREKVFSWIRQIKSGIQDFDLGLELNQQIQKAFKTNLRVILIIDELSPDQKETIRNIMNSFRLESGNPVEFTGYTVRLEQKINPLNPAGEYALSVR